MIEAGELYPFDMWQDFFNRIKCLYQPGVTGAATEQEYIDIDRL